MGLKEHVVKFVETLSRDVKVEAETEVDALEKAEELYRSCEIVLDADDYVGVEFMIAEEGNNDDR